MRGAARAGHVPIGCLAVMFSAACEGGPPHVVDDRAVPTVDPLPCTKSESTMVLSFRIVLANSLEIRSSGLATLTHVDTDAGCQHVDKGCLPEDSIRRLVEAASRIYDAPATRPTTDRRWTETMSIHESPERSFLCEGLDRDASCPALLAVISAAMKEADPRLEYMRRLPLALRPRPHERRTSFVDCW